MFEVVVKITASSLRMDISRALSHFTYKLGLLKSFLTNAFTLELLIVKELPVSELMFSSLFTLSKIIL
jgi:hypothetical protein